MKLTLIIVLGVMSMNNRNRVVASSQIPLPGCPHVTELFNCSLGSGLDCPSNRVSCSLSTSSNCSCMTGYLWLLDEHGNANKSQSEICGYAQISKKQARIWQGTWILGVFAEGAGLVHIGQKHLGTIMLCLAYLSLFGMCIAGCICQVTKASKASKFKWCGIVMWLLCFLTFVGNFIWWAITLQQLQDGKIPDGYGCPLY